MRRLVLAGALAAAMALGQEHGPKGREDHAAAGAPHSPEAAGDPYLGWKWVNFAILAAGLAWMGIKFGAPFFRNRSAEILKDLTDSARIKADAEAKAAEIEARIANLEGEIAKMRDSARAELESERVRMEGETARMLVKIEEHAQGEIASALKSAKQGLSVEAARLAVELAASKIEGSMSQEVRHGLVSGFIRDLEKAKN